MTDPCARTSLSTEALWLNFLSSTRSVPTSLRRCRSTTLRDLSTVSIRPFPCEKRADQWSAVNGDNWGCIYDRADDLIARYKAGHMIGSHTYVPSLETSPAHAHPLLSQLESSVCPPCSMLSSVSLTALAGTSRSSPTPNSTTKSPRSVVPLFLFLAASTELSAGRNGSHEDSRRQAPLLPTRSSSPLFCKSRADTRDAALRLLQRREP